MHPVLVEIGRFRIYSYGAMLALSFWIGILLAARRAGRRGVKPELVFDLSIILILSAVVGSRMLYILSHRGDYHSIVDVIALWQGGATFYGGFILALAGAIVFLRRKRVSFFLVADACAPSIALGFFFTRIGCFLSGCCFGLPTTLPVGIVFPAGSPAGFACPGTPLHPTQLYDAAYGLAMTAALLLVDRKRRYTGFVFGLLCVLAGAGRYGIDFLRSYEPSARLSIHLTTSQLISLGVIAAGAVVMAALRPRKGGARRAGG